jgi:multimeric flavodoxin WrbA
MKVTLINGTNRKGSTYNIAHMILNKLSKEITLETTEFFLPKDFSKACTGCFNCILKDKSLCPHSKELDPLRDSMVKADLIIITSPVYCMDVSGQLKSFLDHFGYMWLSHRPEEAMFNKIGLSVVTAAGAGLKHTSKTIKMSFNWWGVKRYFRFAKLVMASSFEDISEKRLKQIDKDATKLSRQIAKALVKKDKLKATLSTRLFFRMFRFLKKIHPEWNEVDTKYWYDVGYMDGKKPWIVK